MLDLACPGRSIVAAQKILPAHPQRLIPVGICRHLVVVFVIVPICILFISLFVSMCPRSSLLRADRLRRTGGLLMSGGTVCHLPSLLFSCLFLCLFIHREEGIQSKLFPSQEAVDPSP